MIEILIIDDEQSQLDRGIRMLNEVFERVGVCVEISGDLFSTRATVWKEVKRIESKLLSSRPDILICDNKIGRTEAWGQEFIAENKPKLPETTMCLLTRENIKSAQFGLRRPNPDFIIDKGHLSGDDDEYKEYIATKLLRSVTRSKGVKIEWQDDLKQLFRGFRIKGKGVNVSESEVISIVEQCLYTGNVGESPQEVVIEAMEGGRSGSAVLSCQLRGDLTYGISGVLKISGRAAALQELENYNKYVRWVLPYTWKVEVLGFGETEKLGGVCYSFAFDGAGIPQSSACRLRKSDGTIVDAICDSIFNPRSKMWYSQIRDTGTDASRYFQSSSFFHCPEQVTKRQEKFLEVLTSLFPDKISIVGEEISMFGELLLHPHKLLFTEDWGDVVECVCHGDLNANNILVNSTDTGIAFIDFQRTGYHNIFRDFVSFESSIRVEWGEEVDEAAIEDLFLAEIKSIETGNYTGSAYLELVGKIRNVAYQNFSKNSSDHYLIAAYIHFSWLVTRFDFWKRSQRIRLCLGACAAYSVLNRRFITRSEFFTHNNGSL